MAAVPRRSSDTAPVASSTPDAHEELPFSCSQTLGSPSFRNAAVNFVAVVPLLSSRPSEGGSSSTSPTTTTSTSNHSSQSFDDLMNALRRYNGGTSQSQLLQQKQPPPLQTEGTRPEPSSSRDPLILVVPNSSLTRPGDWRYGDTPLRGFHWQHGCQRLAFGDGRPGFSRAAQDRILSAAARDWLDLCPSRRTAAVIGVLNLRDCANGVDDLRRAEEELHSWAARYSSPPYEVTALGRSFERDRPLERLFVFDSFDETCQRIDLSRSGMQDSLLAFPPIDGEEHQQMMDLHMNVVVNDLAVAIFRSLEARIQQSDAISRLYVSALQLAQQEASAAASASSASSSLSVRSSLTRIISGTTAASSSAAAAAAAAPAKDEPVSAASRALSLNSLAGLVSPDSKLAKESYAKSRAGGGVGGSPSTSFVDPAASSSSAPATTATALSQSAASAAALHANTDIQKANSSPKLITPLDSYWERGGLSSKDVDAIRRRDMARREKWAGDVSLLAGSPLDAYERYLKAAEMCRSSSTPDPLWYASALEGCATAHIAMAEAGGYGVDEYLESNFSMPDEVVALLTTRRGEGDAATGGSATGTGKRGGSGTTKQTLPEIVCALCEEALNITNRHEKLGPIHAELLLKLAGYVADSSVGQLRCRWGEGSGCYAGEVDQVPRWERHSVSKLKSPDPLPQHCVAGLDSMATINTYNRTKQVCELLHEAVSIASIDAATRVDVAACCVRLCLSGVKVTQWKGSSERSQVPLLRKAAFFAVVAAEAMTGASIEGSQQAARDLWLLATQLYTKRSNDPGKVSSYGWVGLRTITLNALSLQGINNTSLVAAEELLSLLSEIDPAHTPTDPDGSALFDVPAPRQQVSDHGVRTSQASAHGSTSSHGKGSSSTQSSSHGTRTTQSVTHSTGKPPLDSAVSDSAGGESMNKKASSFARQLRDSFASLTSGSILLAMESRWAENDIIPAVNVPLSASSVQPLGCVWRLVPLNRCMDAQSQCLALISKLHRSLPTQSHGSSHQSPASLPVHVSTSLSIQAETDLELECVKKTVKKDSGASPDPMATFFNPFASQRNSKVQAFVAEGEERAMRVEVSNRLSIPLTVLRCLLEFKCDVPGSIRATPLSFTLPPKASGFLVHFPFVVLPIDEPSQRSFEVTSINMTLAGRVTSIPFDSKAGVATVEGATNHQIPAPASLYHRQTSSVSRSSSVKEDETVELLRVESCPPQPRLQVYLAEDHAPVSFERPIVVSLTEGELYTLPALRLTNYNGPAGLRNVERLQIIAVDVPGSADRMIYDSQVEMAPDPDFAPIIGRDQTPLKLRCLSSSINLSDLNSSDGPGTLVTIQISASYRIRQQISKAASFKLRFRYRGTAGTTSEFWRRREIRFRVTCISGPRISSIDFRPSLLATKSYREICRVLRAAPSDVQSNEHIAFGQRDADLSKISILHRVGMDGSVHIANKEASFILTVSNDTNASLVLSKEGGAAVGGFLQYPISTLLLDPAATAKIPVIVPRVPRISDAATADNLVDQVVGLTKLNWAVQHHQSRGDLTQSESCGEVAQGELSIPRACLVDIIERNPSFVAHVCEAPCEIELLLNNVNVFEASTVSLKVGEPLSVSMKVRVGDWIPQNVLDKCCLTLEFLCSNMNVTSVGGPLPSARLGYVWCGKTRQLFQPQGKDWETVSTLRLNHATKVVFCNSGEYALAACVRISNKSTSKNEVWLAPIIAAVSVGSRDP